MGCVFVGMQIVRTVGFASVLWGEIAAEPQRDALEFDRKGLRCYQLIEPGGEWKLYRYWYEKSAMGDLLGAGFELAEIHKLYHCLDG